MSKPQKARWIAAATAFLALSLPGSSSGQFIPPSLGTWTGVDTFEITVSNFLTGQFISSESGSGPATLSIGTNFMAIAGAHIPIIAEGQFVPSGPFGPTSASGSVSFDDGPGGSSVANFFLTYESILPNGQIDVGNGSAVADLTTIEFDFGESPFLSSTIIESFATFTTLPVPEPPSSVLAGLAILVIAAVALMRSFRRRLQARLS
jgi:hypothetical protein